MLPYSGIKLLQIKNRETMSANLRWNKYMLGMANTRVSEKRCSRKLVSVFEEMVCSNISVNAEMFLLNRDSK